MVEEEKETEKNEEREEEKKLIFFTVVYSNVTQCTTTRIHSVCYDHYAKALNS